MSNFQPEAGQNQQSSILEYQKNIPKPDIAMLDLGNSVVFALTNRDEQGQPKSVTIARYIQNPDIDQKAWEIHTTDNQEIPLGSQEHGVTIRVSTQY